MSSDASTPLMRQYHALKQQVPNALLLFRLGDFYELFFEDAVVAARELEITLTARNKEKDATIPMCGVPYHAANNYITQLIQKGHRVAICDQMEDPRFTKKLVKREITRVVTPGTAIDAGLVRSHENNYLAAVASAADRSAVAHVDLSTGEFRVTELEPGEVAALLEQLGAREVLFPGDLPLPGSDGLPAPRFVRTEVEEWVFTADYANRALRDHFKLLTLDGCGLANRSAAVGAAGAILHYLRETQRAALDHLDRPAFYDRAASMMLDAVTVRNLELTEALFAADASPSGSGAQATLLGVLDQTLTGMGGRLLRQRLLRPSLDRAEIEQRLDALSELREQTILRAELRKRLEGILDLERLLAKVTLGSAGPRDVLALGRSLERIPALKQCFDTQQAARLRSIHNGLDELTDVAGLILDAIADEPPLTIADGGAIRQGFHAGLDELRDLS
ncbi:MAG TPA: DNA mismatch repair protein MutS, partial [Bryobacteraceae bacterium]